MRNFIFKILSLAVVVFVGFWVYRLYNYIFVSKDNIIIEASTGAFAGAFFSYLFLRIGTFFRSIYDRQIKHYNSLVFLERDLADTVQLIYDNIYTLKGFAATITKGEVFMGNFSILPIDKTGQQGLNNIDLVNDLQQFFVQVRKTNQDMEALFAGYSEIKNALIQKKMTINNYVYNAKRTIESMVIPLIAFSEELEKEAVLLSAVIRLSIIKDRPIGLMLRQILYGNRKTRLNNEAINNEISVIRREQAEMTKLAGQRIEKIKKSIKV